MRHSLSTLSLLVCVAAAPALAGDDLIQPEPCGVFCKVWRNVSGRVHVRVPPDTSDDHADYGTIPTVDEEARTPDVNALVTVHGEIVVKTAAERAKEQRMLHDEESRIDGLRPADLGQAAKR